MSEDRFAWPAELPARLRAPLQRAADGLPANVALMHILMQCESREEAQRVIAAGAAARELAGDTPSAARLRAMRDLLDAHPGAFDTVRATVSGLDHAKPGGNPAESIAYWAAAFDDAARRSAEGSVALYTLGDPSLLAAATGEIADRLDEWGLLQRDTRCLDIGCGIGRMELALTARVGQITGIDIAPIMVAEARRRTQGLSNVTIRHTAGRDLAEFGEGSFDLVLAVDCFPYVVQAGTDLVATMLGETGRVLRPGGSAVILNYSYRGDPERDATDLAALAAPAGLRMVRSAAADFFLWDAATFILQRN